MPFVLACDATVCDSVEVALAVSAFVVAMVWLIADVRREARS